MPMIHILAEDDDGNPDIERTERMIAERKPGQYRQCSIGYHDECSSPDECTCDCHGEG